MAEKIPRRESRPRGEGGRVMAASAVISPCGTYRYRLTREWANGEKVLFIMLNPSTADAEKDDPTIRKCIGFARQWGYNGLTVVNLFAFRATDPRELLATKDPIGPDNDTEILAAIAGHERIVAAWGAKAWTVDPDRIRKMIGVDFLGVHAHAECFGLTKDGAPKHPLYVPYATNLVQYT